MEEIYYHREINIALPPSVKQILETLNEAGFEAYAVGGCVRDSVLGRYPKDWDITTSARPKDVKALFKRTVDTGIQHGTVTVMIKKEGFEVTTYRVDGRYTDGRHPEGVSFTGNLAEDLKRRDFTVNAMAYNEDKGLVDCFGGLDDLKEGIIRCVGSPEERFSEDALRMLRAVRFSGVLGFSIEEETYKAIKRLAFNIAKISRERIQAELDKLLTSPNPDRIRALCETGLMDYIFLGKKAIDGEGALEELTERLNSCPADHYLRWAVFAGYVGGTESLEALKFDNATIKLCVRLHGHRRKKLASDEALLRFAIAEIGTDIFWDYYLPYKKVMGDFKNEEEYDAILKLSLAIRDRGDCLTLGTMKINGHDLRAMGVRDGKCIGEILKKLFSEVLYDNTKNDREYLIKRAESFANFPNK